MHENVSECFVVVNSVFSFENSVLFCSAYITAYSFLKKVMDSDLHHKMCKKVAQLTKVIFYLNTKNDEY